MARLLILSALLCSLAGSLAAQHTPNGFYVIIPELTGCINPVYGFTPGKQYCLPKDPLIPATQFTSVSDMQYNNRESLMYVNLYLTQEGLRKLRAFSKTLPDATLALVIDDVVTGSFDSRGKEVVNSIPISGPKGSDEVEWIWLKLKKITARN
jgi:preprotein translocase subunit SecD